MGAGVNYSINKTTPPRIGTSGGKEKILFFVHDWSGATLTALFGDGVGYTSVKDCRKLSIFLGSHHVQVVHKVD